VQPEPRKEAPPPAPRADAEVPPFVPSADRVIEVEAFNLFYGPSHALKDVSMSIGARQVTALIGPSGCGKSTLLRSMNRLNDLVDGVRVTGDIRLRGESVYRRGVDVISLRKRMSMVFQKQNPFPKSIYENVVFGLRVAGERRRQVLDEAVERSLTQSALWEEVKDRLQKSALDLSGGRQQRLCIARAIATRPEVLLMDEPCSALDPIATARIEDLIVDLKTQYTVVIVTHNMQQAARVADVTAFMYLGRLVEVGETTQVFERPRSAETEAYITGRYG
jgi:phosphate transport system ATP-binding protein